MVVKEITSLSSNNLIQLNEFIKINEEKILPYHLLEYNYFIDKVFGYRNFSLIAYDGNNDIIGYLPQWQKGNTIESIPWRDKGGPIVSDTSVIAAFIEETKKLIEKYRLKGFIWRDFETDLLKCHEYFINVDIELKGFTVEKFWRAIGKKVRQEIKNAQKNDLTFQLEKEPSQVIDAFYRVFLENKKRLGIPVYSKKFIIEHFLTIPQKNIKLFSVYRGSELLSSLIILHTSHKAIAAYIGLSSDARKLKANYLLFYKLISYCIDNGIRYLDFGADSPFQETLIFYKMKWLGEKRKIRSSIYGNIKEIDHNTRHYDLIKVIIRNMPIPLYQIFSKIVVK